MTNEDYLSARLHFSEEVWIDKLQYFHEEIYFLTMVAMEIGKDNFSLIIATVATRKKSFIKTLFLIDSKNHS